MARRRRNIDVEDFFIESRSRRFFRRLTTRIRRLFYLLVLSAIALLVFLPTLLSSQWGRETVLDILNTRIPGTIQVETLYLSWFGSQSMGGVELRTPDRRLVLRAGEVRLETGIFQLLSDKKDLGILRLVQPTGTLIYDEESGRTNLQDALGLGVVEDSTGRAGVGVRHSDDWTLQLPYTGRIIVESGQVTLIQNRVDPVTFRSVDADLQFQKLKGPFVVSMKGESRQADLGGTFDVDAVLSGFNRRGEFRLVRDENGFYRTVPGSDISVRAKLANLPLEGVDQLIALQFPNQRGLLTASLGKSMDLEALINMDSEDVQLDLKAHSPTLRAIFRGETQNGSFTLAEPGSMTIAVTPTFFDYLKQVFRAPESLRLMKTSSLAFEVSRLVLPLSPGLLDYPGLAFDAKMAFQDAQLLGDAAFGELNLSHTRASISTDRLSDSMVVAFNSDLTYNGLPSSIVSHMTLAQFLASDGAWTPDQVTGEVSILARDVPIPVLDEWASMEGMLVEAAGDKLNLTWESEIRKGASHITLGLETSNFKISDAKVSVGEQITLLNEVSFDYLLAANLANRFLPPDRDIRLLSDVGSKIEVKELSIPWNREGEPMDWEKVHLTFAMSVDAARVGGLPHLGIAQFSKWKVDVTEANLGEPLLHFSGQIAPEDQESLIVKLGGQSFSLNGEGKLKTKPKGGFDLLDTSLEIGSDRLSMRLLADIEGLDLVSLQKPVEIEYELDPEGARLLGIGGAGRPEIVEPTKFQLQIERLAFSLSQLRFDETRMEGDLRLAKLAVRFPEQTGIDRLENFRLRWLADVRQSQAVVDLETSVLSGGKKGDLSVEAQFADFVNAEGKFDWQSADIAWRSDANDLPVGFLQSLTGRQDLTPIVGSSLSGYANFRTVSIDPPEGVLAFRLEGEEIAVSGGFAVQEDFRTFRNPLTIQWRVSPERFKVVRQLLHQSLPALARSIDHLELVDTVEFGAQIGGLSVPWNWVRQTPVAQWFIPGLGQGAEAPGVDYTTVSLQVDFRADPFALRDPINKDTLNFEKFQLFFSAPDLRDTVAFGISAEMELTDPMSPKDAEPMEGVTDIDHGQGQPSRVVIKGQLTDLLGENDDLQLDQMSARVALSAGGLPTTLLGSFFTIDEAWKRRFGAIFGQLVDVVVTADLDRMSGPVDVKMSSSVSEGQIQGEIIEGVLLLKNDLTLEAQLTSALSREVLAYIHPILETATASSRPIRLRIEPEDFRLPVFPLDLGQASWKLLTLSVGRVTLENSGLFGDMLDLLALQVLDTKTEINAEFTPFYVSAKEGRLSVKRTDFLVEDYFHLATWGNIYYPSRQLDLRVGFTNNTMRAAYGIKALPEDYLFIIPVKGRVEGPDVDMADAEGRLGNLYGIAFGSQKTRLFGGVIGEDLGRNVDIPEAPRPTVVVMPWGDRDGLDLGLPEFDPTDKHPSRRFGNEGRGYDDACEQERNSLWYRNFIKKL